MNLALSYLFISTLAKQFQFYKMIFQSNYALVIVELNKVSAKNLKSGIQKTVIATKPFSNNRLLIAEFVEFESALRKVIKGLFPSSLFWPSLAIIYQTNNSEIGQLTSTEKRTFRDAAEFVGARHVYFNSGLLPINNLKDFKIYEAQLER